MNAETVSRGNHLFNSQNEPTLPKQRIDQDWLIMHEQSWCDVSPSQYPVQHCLHWSHLSTAMNRLLRSKAPGRDLLEYFMSVGYTFIKGFVSPLNTPQSKSFVRWLCRILDVNSPTLLIPRANASRCSCALTVRWRGAETWSSSVLDVDFTRKVSPAPSQSVVVRIGVSTYKGRVKRKQF